MLVARPATLSLAFPTQSKPLPRRGAFVISSKMHRRRRPRPRIQYNHKDEDEADDSGAVGLSILEALNSDASPKAVESRRSDVSWIEEEREEKTPSTSLRGSDVLFALQRAAAQKASRGRKGSKGRPNRNGSSEDGFGDLSNVRPIAIRRDWGARLDEIERKLEELMKLEENSA